MSEDIRRQYQAPSFARHDLRTITLGGSPGIADSGPSGFDPPIDSFGGESNDDWEESFDEIERPDGY